MKNDRAAVTTNVVNERWGRFIGDSLSEVPAWKEIPKSGDSLIAPDSAECQEKFDCICLTRSNSCPVRLNSCTSGLPEDPEFNSNELNSGVLTVLAISGCP